MSVQSSLTSPYASRQNSHAAVARERNAKMKRELSNQSADGYNDYNDDDEFGGSGHEERSKCRSSGSGSGGSSSSERRNPKATRQYSDADSPYDSKSNRK